MSHLVVLLLMTAPVAAPPTALPAASDWRNGNAAAGYVMEAAGRATDPDGATLTLRAPAQPAGFGNTSATIPADAVRLKRITLSGELQASGVTDGASLWLRIDKGPAMLMLENGAADALKGTTEWTRRAITLPVPSDATSLVFGILLRGAGSVTVRRLRLEAGAAIAADAPIAPKARAILDEAIGIAREHSLHRQEIAWPEVERNVRALAAGADDSAAAYPAIRYLLAALNDRHSFLLPPAQTTAFRTGGASNPIPEIRTNADGVGIITMAGYSGGDQAAAKKYAEDVHKTLLNVQGGAACGWVVDLRPNTGGNMWPMLAGLKPFLGNEPLGTFESPGESSPPWRAGMNNGVEPPAALAPLESAWVAVITGPRTASSGEAVTIAFKGRPRTRSFGQPTAGLSTANETFPLADGAMMLLTTAIEADRTGKRYGDKVDPDQPHEAAGTNGDPAMAAATVWLKTSTACRR
jgi:C-terminal processing protease CtpA/Prc